AGNLRPLNERIEEAALGLGEMDDTAKSDALAGELFGEAGLAFVRIGQGGAAALAQAREQFEKLTGGNFDEFVERSRKVAVAMDKWRLTATALRQRIATALLPVITRVVTWVSRMITRFQELT